MKKQQKAELCRLAELAYERELGRELEWLHAHSEAWKTGELRASDLSHHIHTYHQGPAREIWSRHQTLERPEKQVAWGLARGLLEESEVDPALQELVVDSVEAYRRALDR